MHTCVNTGANNAMVAAADGTTCDSLGFAEFTSSAPATVLVRFDDAYFPDAVGTAALIGGVVTLWALAWAIRSLRSLASTPTSD